MCGIIGYLGTRNALPILIEGLKRLEYRGYDSAGLALLEPEIQLAKAVGKIADLESSIRERTFDGTLGIAHTRWATHGEPTWVNAHPHLDCSGKLAVVHNGIVENYSGLKHQLELRGHRFTTDTDTEVIAHLIEECYQGDLTVAVSAALRDVEGTYGLAIVHADHPRTLVGARCSSPLLVGRGIGEYFLASDVSAVLKHTRDVTFLDDGDIVTITDAGSVISTVHNGGAEVSRPMTYIDWELEKIERGGYDHFMLKEIHEQPETLANAMRGHLIPVLGNVNLGGLQFEDVEEVKRIKRIVLIGCGTSWHASLLGEYLIEDLARLPVEVEYASEFRYRNPILEEGTAVVVISQSGETIDTLEALREAKERLPNFQRLKSVQAYQQAFGIVNVVGSSIAREVGLGVYIHAGPEIGVASTKAFTSQALVLLLLAFYLGRRRGSMTEEQGKELIAAIEALPDQVGEILSQEAAVREIAERYHQSHNALYLGRGLQFPIALEGALKLKEVSGVHAEGYPAAEMKHGPIALIDEQMPVVVIGGERCAHRKILGNIEEVKTRKGRIIAVATRGDEEIIARADHVITIPRTHRLLVPILSVVPLQLLAYHVAVLRGLDPDRPRNLAKSVTVE